MVTVDDELVVHFANTEARRLLGGRLAEGDPGDRCHLLASDRTQRFYRGYALSRRLTRGEYAN
ncbi:MAG: hypothetical protein ABR562_07180, partial [Thermoplasmatota archaeon]